MIASNELRIGNWFTVGESKPFQITGIFHEYVWSLINETDFPIAELNPIPLTPEWLERAGFVQAYDSYGGQLSPELQEGSRIRVKDNVWLSGYIDVKLDYVHQLQNLYWCLCGKELEFH